MHKAVWRWKWARDVAIFAAVAAVCNDLGDIAVDGPANHEIVDVAGCNPGHHEKAEYVVADYAEVEVFKTFCYLLFYQHDEFGGIREV